MAVAALVLGIVSIPGAVLPPLGFVCGLGGFVMGIISRRRILGSAGIARKGARGAAAGTICGGLGVGLAIGVTIDSVMLINGLIEA